MSFLKGDCGLDACTCSEIWSLWKPFNFWVSVSRMKSVPWREVSAWGPDPLDAVNSDEVKEVIFNSLQGTPTWK